MFITRSELNQLSETTETETWEIPEWTAESNYESIDITDVIQELVDQEGFDGTILLKLESLTAGTRGAYGVLHGTPELEIDWEVLEGAAGLGATIDSLLIDPLTAGVGLGAAIDSLAERLPIETFELGDLIIATLDVVHSDVGLGATIESSIEQIPDSLIFTDTSESEVTGVIPEAIADSLFSYDTPSIGFNLSALDEVDLADSPSKLLCLLMSDWLTLTDTQIAQWDGVDIVEEGIGIYDIPVMIKSCDDTLADAVNLADAGMIGFLISALEYMRFTGLVSALRESQHSAEESLTLTDDATRGFSLALASVLNAVDVSSVIISFIRSISESLAATDSASVFAEICGQISDSLTVTETIAGQSTLYRAIYDTLAINALLEMDGDTWECYVLNTPSFLPSMYSGFDFNSYCVYENRAFGANDEGIYELTGDTDAGATVHTGVVLSGTDFDSPSLKRFRRGYLGISGTAPLLVLETESGQKQAYTVDTNGRAVFSRELKGERWKLSVADFDTLDSMNLVPVMLAKRVMN